MTITVDWDVTHQTKPPNQNWRSSLIRTFTVFYFDNSNFRSELLIIENCDMVIGSSFGVYKHIGNYFYAAGIENLWHIIFG